MIEGVLVDDPASLVDALGELGEGHIALVANDGADLKVAPTRWLRVRPAAIRRLLAHLHGARDLAEAKALQASLPEGDSIITQSGERLGRGWLRVSRSGAAEQALLREREIQELREQIEQLQDREAELEDQLAGFREQLQAAEQQREDARALYQAHRAVSELAGQLQGQQGRWRLHARASTASKAS